MKKLLALTMTILMVAMLLVACGGTSSSTAASGDSSAAPDGSQSAAAGDGYEIAMITDKGNIDDKSFNQGTWEGVQMYANANGKTCQYYKPTEVSDDAYLAAIDLAVQGGAKVVVTPGFLFANAIGAAQLKYPDVTFILIDATPTVNDEPVDIEANCVGVTYAEEQAGYLAGYAAVMDGHESLGFMGGMAVPAVVRFGFGYVQGANDAAKELGITVDMKYFYTGGFEAAPEWVTMATGWYNDGATVIFGCGGSVGNSVFKAAEDTGNKSIGVDVDQSAESETIITSAIKGLRESVNLLLGQYYEGTFPGGTAQVLGAAEGSVGLPIDTSRFETFDKTNYEVIFDGIAKGEVTIATNEASPDENPANMAGVDLSNVNLTYITQ